MQQQRERSCTRCQSFHRHHHRQRRRSSDVHQLRNDFSAISSTSANLASGITKAIVNITPSNAKMTQPTVSTAFASGSTLTVTSMPSLMLGGAAGGSSPTGSMTPAITTPMSASAISIQTPSIATKHCTFALTPTTIPPPPNQVSFLATARYHPSLRQKSSPNQTPLPTPTSINASSISLADLAVKPMQSTTAAAHHPTLEMRQSVQSEMTSVEDEYDDIMEVASSSSSMSSLGLHGEK